MHMPFRALSIEWRFDTMIMTALLMITGVVCTGVITHFQRQSVVVMRQTLNQIVLSQKTQASVSAKQDELLGELTLLRVEHKAAAAQEEKNFQIILELEKQLKERNR